MDRASHRTAVMAGVWLLTVAFFFNMGNSRVRALDPAPCPKWACKSIYAFWSCCNWGTQSWAYKYQGTTNNWNLGTEDIYATTSVEDVPVIGDSAWFDSWVYPASNATCGKDQQGNWQSSQEVSPTGFGRYSGYSQGHQSCTLPSTPPKPIELPPPPAGGE